jgi:hypothetical protein
MCLRCDAHHMSPERRADRSIQTEGNVVVQLSHKHEAFLCVKESLWAS